MQNILLIKSNVLAIHALTMKSNKQVKVHLHTTQKSM